MALLAEENPPPSPSEEDFAQSRAWLDAIVRDAVRAWQLPRVIDCDIGVLGPVLVRVAVRGSWRRELAVNGPQN